MKNRLGYLSLLALLGFLGIFTQERGYLGFFGFLYYIRYFTVIPDELFLENVRKAATPAFFTWIAASSVAIALKVLLNSPALAIAGMGLSMALAIAVFTIILTAFEIKENGENRP
jgi:hypothetical protein